MTTGRSSDDVYRLLDEIHDQLSVQDQVTRRWRRDIEAKLQRLEAQLRKIEAALQRR